ncbi:MAG TPA: hypothetical protein VI912_05820 [Candidatus Bilamarchaeaceae archaeon]|nr:hypothetical protein [Candidatus Bilamarchaeaceae archaeon]
MSKKLVIGWFTFTCCEDSTILFVELMNENYFKWKEQIEFKHCKMLKSKNEMGQFDVAFVEGAISTDEDKKELEKIRGLSKYLVAIGSCACSGYPSAQRNDFDEKTKKEILPVLKNYNLWENVLSLDKIVKVDDNVPGCPMTTKKFMEVLDKYLKLFEVV